MTRIRFDSETALNVPNINELNNVVISPTEPTTGEEVWIQRSNNLFDIDKAKLAWLSRNKNEISFNDAVYYGELRYNYDFEINKPYTFSFNILEASMVTMATVLFFYTDGSYSEKYINDTGVGKYSTTLTPTKRVSFLELRFFRLSNNTTQRTGKVTDIQIEQGYTATTYEPYMANKIYTKNDNNEYDTFYDETNREVYSTAEQRIGTWIDGKPIYRAVYSGDIPNGTKLFSNVDAIIRLDGYCFLGSSTGDVKKVILNGVASNAPNVLFSCFYAIGNTLEIYAVSSGSPTTAYNSKIILEYTKTTD